MLTPFLIYGIPVRTILLRFHTVLSVHFSSVMLRCSKEKAPEYVYCIPGRINFIRGTTRLEKELFSGHHPEIFSPLLCVTCMNVLTYLLPFKQETAEIQPVCSRVFPSSSPPNGALSR